MASTTEKVLKAKIQMIDNYTKPAKKVVAEAKKVEKATKNMKATITAKDNATKVIKKVTAMAKAFAGRSYKALVTVKDGASSILNKLKSTMGMLAAGVTIGVAVKAVGGGAMDLEEQKVSMNHFMGLGNKGKDTATVNKMTDDFIKTLRTNANATPFETGEVIGAGTRALGLSGGNTKEAMKLVTLAENMAALTPSKTISDAMEALADSNLGEMERLKEFNYKGSSKDDPKETIKRLTETFDGGAEKLSKTAKGKFSTSMGTLKSGLADFGTAFLPIMSKAFDGVTNMLNKVSPKFLELSFKIADTFEKFSKSKEAKVLMDIFGTGAKAAFDMIKAAIDACRPTVENIMRFMQEHSEAITGGIEGLKGIWEGLCNILGPVLSVAWALIEPILLVFLGMIEDLGRFIKDVGDKWKAMSDAIKNNPVVAKVTTWFDGAGSRPQATDNSPKSQGTIFDKGKRSAYGTSRVVGNDVPYRLHSGEKVLTRSEADRYDKGNSNGGINIFMNGTTIREESDINKIAKALVRELKLSKDVAVMGV